MSNEQTLVEALIEKWSPLLESDDLPEIKDNYRKSVTAILLENEEKALAEASSANVAAGVANWDPVLMGMVRRAMPQLIAFDIAGVQPMTGPTGLIFALKSRYLAPGTDSGKNTTNQTEALWNEANGGYASTGAFAGYIGSQFLSVTTNTSTTTTTASTVSLAVGMPVVGTGFPVGCTIATIVDGTSFTTSAATTASGTVTATFGMGNSFGTVNGLTTAVGEGDITAKMGFTIEKTSVEAQTYQLATGYSIELAQDMRAIHGLDAESELTNILSGELIAEQNRNVLRRLYTVAKAGAQSGVNNQGIFDLATDSDGRWSNERFKGLIFAIERDANRIALDIRLGKGNILVCSADVASALAAAGTLDYAPALAGLDALNADFTTNTFVGVMSGGRMKVFVDPYASGDFYMVGYKGTSPYAAGYFYCPYVAAQMLRATDPLSFQPLIGLKMRYGQTYNPMSGSASFRQNGFYRIAAVTNVLS